VKDKQAVIFQRWCWVYYVIIVLLMLLALLLGTATTVTHLQQQRRLQAIQSFSFISGTALKRSSTRP